MDKLFESWRKFICEASSDITEKFQVYLVGGAVRDQLLQRTSHDLDYLVVGATPQDMIEAGFEQVGVDFPVFLHPETGEEYALARQEKKTGTGYKGFDTSIEGVPLEKDLERRDLTINAIARQLLPGGQYGEYIDPFGGRKDIENKLLRHVSDAFQEDPTRVLRVARFAAQLGFGVDESTKQLIRKMAENGVLNELKPERIWKEVEKSLESDNPDIFFEVLKDTGALEKIFPEIHKYIGVPQVAAFHGGLDVWGHVIEVIKKAKELTSDPVVIWAAVMHDLGKTATDPKEYPKHHGHEEAGEPLVAALCDRLKVPSEYKELAVLVARYHMKSHRSLEMNGGKLVQFFNSLDAFRREDRFKKFLIAVTADALSKPGKEYPEKDFLIKAFNYANTVSGKTFVEKGLKGKKVGEAIHQARAALVKRAKKDFEKEKSEELK